MNGLNEIKTVNAANVIYDANGNLTSDPMIARTYTYDSENRMTSSSAGTVDATLRRDPLGRLESYDLDPGATTRFIYDPVSGAGSEVAAEVSLSGTITRRYIRGKGADEILLEYVGSGSANPRYHLLDERMSAIAEADATGAMLTINAYDEYGMPAADNTGRFQYTGQMWLGEVGAYNYKARMYAPHLGRFMQTDPIGHAGGVNLYAYVGNDPTNLVDSFGLQACQGYTHWRFKVYPSGKVEGPFWMGNYTFCSPQTIVELQAAGEGGGGGTSKSDQAESEPEVESEACRILRDAADRAKRILPARVGLHGGFQNEANLTFYRLTYQDNLRDAQVAGYGLFVTGLVIGAASLVGILTESAGYAGGTGIAFSELGSSLLSGQYSQFIDAIEDIEKYNQSGC